jgi:hypothetical protein
VTETLKRSWKSIRALRAIKGKEGPGVSGRPRGGLASHRLKIKDITIKLLCYSSRSRAENARDSQTK